MLYNITLCYIIFINYNVLINDILINRHNKTKHPAQGTGKEMFSCIRLGSRQRDLGKFFLENSKPQASLYMGLRMNFKEFSDLKNPDLRI